MKFDFPTLKVGTLDALMLLSDELDKYDKHADMTIRRIVRSWVNDVGDENDKTSPTDLTTDLGSGDIDAMSALQNFHWQEDRFPHKGSLPELAQNIHRQICELDDEVKENLGKFSQIRNAINAHKRKSGGNLLVKDLNGIVDQRSYVTHPNGDLSDKIVPVFVVVGRHKLEEFHEKYESLSKEVVPKSWKVISEDDSYVLGRVLHLDCPSLDTFKIKISDNKCTVREFAYDAQAVEDNQADKHKLLENEKEARELAKNTLSMAFSEVFLVHLHLKAVRIFVESVLWYGLPVNFQAMVIKVNARKEAGLQAALDKGFADAKGSGNTTRGEGDDDRPYLHFPFELDFLIPE